MNDDFFLHRRNGDDRLTLWAGSLFASKFFADLKASFTTLADDKNRHVGIAIKMR